MSPAQTHQQLLKHFQSPEMFERLVAIAHTEPPRALGQELGYSVKGIVESLL